ncbi:unnamed protein product [Cylicocyclus nassatus]|uniref:Reduced folate carrier n=1 Tax=Cylicocyclus nassatus TaxID=53992 RepID=A0AA36DQV3_CYLNA|nr:unnamed protein product [Cylicocyclus nassatus]
MKLVISKWKITTILLCTYGFLKEFRPTEPFLYQYEHETLNISEHTLNADVYPIWTYSYMVALIPVFLLTDLLLYKSLIVVEALAYIVVWCLLVFAGSVLSQQILEFFYGWATATEIAYFAYIYVNVSKEKFKSFQITNYTQTLWGSIIDVQNSEIYNGVTEALCPLIGLPVVFLVQYLRVDWSRWGELCLALCSLLDGFILFLLSQTDSLLVMYIGYVVYRVLYQAMITVTQFNLADSLETASYGLVFGLNTFAALVLQSILTLVVTSSFGLALSIRPQFVVYSGYHFVVAAIFIVPPIYRVLRKVYNVCKN